MQSRNDLIEESAIASVLPGEYARFRDPIRGALLVFLEGLPSAHQSAILADQADACQAFIARITAAWSNCSMCRSQAAR
jgi:hypothetical protein